MIDNNEGQVRLEGKWWERAVFGDGKVMWTDEEGKSAGVAEPVTHEQYEEGKGWARFQRLKFRRGNAKLFRKLERLWAKQSAKPDPSSAAQTSDTGRPVQRFPRVAEGKSGKASASAAVFESTDPRYCLKLFPTLSKKYPGQSNIHVYMNPNRQHKFYTVPIESAIRETEKFLALLKQMAGQQK